MNLFTFVCWLNILPLLSIFELIVYSNETYTLIPIEHAYSSRNPQPKFPTISYAQALAASTIPLQSIRNIRILGEYEEASVTALRMKQDKRFMESGIREITQKSRFNFTLKCKSEEEAKNIHDEFVKTYGNGIEIGAPRETLPMIKITNIVDEIVDVKAVEETIRNSNYWATDLEFRVSDHYIVNAFNGKYSNVLLETRTKGISRKRENRIWSMDWHRVGHTNTRT